MPTAKIDDALRLYGLTDDPKGLDKITTCRQCGGVGRAVNPDAMNWEHYWSNNPCETCHGIGYVLKSAAI